MMLYASSCERPSKSSPSVFLPSSVSNSYSYTTRTQGSSRRFLWLSSFSSSCSPSSFASSSRAACHSSWVPILCSDISKPPVGLERFGGAEPDLQTRRYRDHRLRPLMARKLIVASTGPDGLVTPPVSHGWSSTVP